MQKIPLVSGLKIIKVLKKFGWVPVRQKGSHIILKKQGEKRSVPVPNHKEVDRNLVKEILKETKVSIKDFLRYLFMFLFKK